VLEPLRFSVICLAVFACPHLTLAYALAHVGNEQVRERIADCEATEETLHVTRLVLVAQRTTATTSPGGSSTKSRSRPRYDRPWASAPVAWDGAGAKACYVSCVMSSQHRSRWFTDTLDQHDRIRSAMFTMTR